MLSIKKCLMVFAVSITVISANAQSGSYQNDFKLVREAITNYIGATANNAFTYAPAGVEGETGCFNEKMATRSMDKLADPMDEFKFYSSLGSKFYEMFYTFSLQSQMSFKQCGNHIGGDMHTQHLLYDCTECNINHILEISNHTLRMFLSSDVSNPLLEKVRDNVLHLYASVNHDNNSSQGCRATGWLTWSIHNAARAGLDHLNAVNVNNRTSTAGKVGMVMSHFYKNILALPVQDFDTWLSPEWQVGYYVIMYSTYLELTNMDFTPNSTSYLDYAAQKN